MRNVFFVQPDEAELARALEKKLLSLPIESGVLFVGVSVMPDPLDVHDRRPLYRIVIGCSRDREPSLMDSLARGYLKELVDERQLMVEAYRGLDRTAISA